MILRLLFPPRITIAPVFRELALYGQPLVGSLIAMPSGSGEYSRSQPQ